MNITNLAQVTSLNTVSASAQNALSYSVGKWSGIILGTSLLAIGGLAAYRWSQDTSPKDTTKDSNLVNIQIRIGNAYRYVLGGLLVTTVTAGLAHVAGLSRHILANRFYCVPLIGLTTIGSVCATILIDKKNTKAKHIALAILNISIGLSFSTLGYIKSNVIAQAAAVTMLFGSALTLTVHLAPNKEFLKWEGPLLTALSTISIASFVATFFPTTAFAYGIDRVSLYGGLLIFSGLFMASTQRLIEDSEKQTDAQFDPINASLNIYLDTLNIFVRLVRIFSENQKKEEKFV